LEFVMATNANPAKPLGVSPAIWLNAGAATVGGVTAAAAAGIALLPALAVGAAAGLAYGILSLRSKG
jgi:hypothetical protein